MNAQTIYLKDPNFLKKPKKLEIARNNLEWNGVTGSKTMD